MLGRHRYDPDFLNSSKELKLILFGAYGIPSGGCLDIPCGNGRNIFLLASYFDKVTGVDINNSYLEELNSMASRYQSKNVIQTERIDISGHISGHINQYSFISNIHFYNYSLATRIIDQMREDAFFYIETPTCAGGNYEELPTDREVQSLIENMDVLVFKKNTCKSASQRVKSISFKALLRKK